jgi:3-phenylpropionate/trans-cinnamate dioxygenase ferredoxin reductase component
MMHYKYLIVGGGMTADAAVRGIRAVDPQGAIGLFSVETDPPYARPPLSKGLWKKMPLKNIWRINAARDASLHLGCKIESIDRQNHRVTDDQGVSYEYEKLLLATGGTPKRFSFDMPGIIYFRTLADYRRLRTLTEEKKQFAVIGSGFIGSEIAAALAMNGKEVAMIFPGEAIGDRIFPPDLSRFIDDYYCQKGVEVISGEEVLSIELRQDKYLIKIHNTQAKSEREIVVEAVVAGLGIEPNVELARQAGLEVSDGIRVDRSLQTSLPDIFSAGDVASFFNPALDKFIRVEHEDNANTMGETAGRSMAGQPVSYDHLPYFYSDLFELGFEAVGEVDSRLETAADWKEPFRKGVIYYMREGLVRGVLLWNVWDKIDAARELIGTPNRLKL